MDETDNFSEPESDKQPSHDDLAENLLSLRTKLLIGSLFSKKNFVENKKAFIRRLLHQIIPGIFSD